MYWLKVIVVCSFIFLPKFNIVSFSSLAQGIRLEDLLMVFTFALDILSTSQKNLSKYFLSKEGFALLAYLYISGLLLLLAENMFSPLFYAIRLTEYFIVASFSRDVFPRFLPGLSRVFYIYILFNFFGVFFSIGQRYQGLTSGPWELGTICVVLTIALTQFVSRNINVFYYSLVSIILFIANARTQILAICLAYAPYFLRTVSKAYILILIIFVPLISFGLVFLFGDPMAHGDFISDNRLSGLSFSSLRELVDRLSPLISYANDASSAQAFMVKHFVYDNSVDASMLMRTGIWIKSGVDFVQGGPFSWLFGIGLAKNGIAIDGTYVRLLFETGFIGVFFFIRFFFSMIKLITPSVFKSALVSFLIFSAFTTDLITSSRIFVSISVAIFMLASQSRSPRKIDVALDIGSV